MTRTTFATAVLLLACFNNSSAAETSDKLAACAAIQSDAERVACYDAIVHGPVQDEVAVEEAAVEATAVEETVVQEAVVEEAAAATVVIESTSTVETPPADETFGEPVDDLNREAGVPAGSEKVDRLVATVSGVRLYKVDRVIITLDNGQEWRQTSASTKEFSVGDTIEINKGSFGSYRMTELDGSNAMKVRRVD